MKTEVRPNIKLPIQQPVKGGMYRRYIKKPMDFILSLCAIIGLSPVLLAVAVLVRVKLGNPVIFKQKRPGLNEKIFTLYKFRTMTDAKDENGEMLPDLIRLTKFGNMLRKASIDEIPELFNMLKGDMSIVGPRPLVIEYLPFYASKERQRHDMRPGLTGLAQISGRSYLSWEERFELDNKYIRNCSFVLDCKIVLETALQVLRRKNIADIKEIRTDEKGECVFHQGRIFRRLDQERKEAKCLKK